MDKQYTRPGHDVNNGIIVAKIGYSLLMIVIGGFMSKVGITSRNNRGLAGPSSQKSISHYSVR